MTLDISTCDELLATTRAVRKRLDLTRPVPREVIEACLELAVQAPTGSNSQTWRWLVVDDADKRQALADLYRRGGEAYLTAAGETATGQTARVFESALYLMEHLHEVPVHVIPCLEGRPREGASVTQLGGYYASIYPAVWNFQLALRARGLGSCPNHPPSGLRERGRGDTRHPRKRRADGATASGVYARHRFQTSGTAARGGHHPLEHVGLIVMRVGDLDAEPRPTRSRRIVPRHRPSPGHRGFPCSPVARAGTGTLVRSPTRA